MCSSDLEAVAGASVVFLAVKPDQIESVVRQAAQTINPSAIVVSVAAGVPLAKVTSWLPSGFAVIRTMPNTPMQVGRGVVAVSAGIGCNDSQLALVAAMFEPMAAVISIEEDLLDAVTATSGSGPAYVFYLAEAMQRGAQELGLPEDAAATLVAETIAGAGELLVRSPGKAGDLRSSVTSKGGTTAAACAVFDTNRVRDVVLDAMVAARDRARELASGEH